MVSWWPGDGNANDIQGSNNGTLQGPVTFTPGIVGQAFNFNGSGYVDATDFGLPVGNSSATISAWIKTTQTGLQFIASWGSRDVCNAGYEISIGIYNDHFILGSCGGHVQGTTIVDDGAWHHVAAVWYGSNIVTLYVDGVQQTNISPDPLPSMNIASSGHLNIGQLWQYGGNFVGLVDEVQIFNRALCASEIQAIYNAGSAGECRPTPTPTPNPTCTPPPPDMVSWWPGDDNANDIQNSNNGILQNGASFAAGKVGRAFSFDGVGSYVVVPDSPNLDFSPISPLTVDAWVFRTSNSSIQHILGKRPGCGGQISYQLVYVQGALVFGGDAGTGVQGGDIPLNAWTHVAGTFDGSTWSVYVNGGLVGRNCAGGTLGPVTDAPLTIGTSGDCAPFGGLVDEVELFNRALSASEIQAIVNAGSAGKCKPTPTPTPTSTPTPTPSPTPTPTPSYAAQSQQPINADGTTVFTVRRGVVPVKFTLTQGGVATCALPPATIAVYRTGTAGNEQIDESIYTMPADSGSNFRIDSCQYVYNLNSSALGVGTYHVDIKINGQVVGSATFQLK